MIDVTVLFGASPRQQPAEAYGLAAAIQELATHDVTAALICAQTGAQYRHDAGNAETFAAVEMTGPTKLYPVATINPVQYLGWQAEVDRTLASGAGAFAFFPDRQGWAVESAAFQTIAKRVALAGRPILISMGAFGDASRIGAATAHLGIPVVLVGAHYTQLADCLAALAVWPHLHLETSRLGQFRGVETVVQAVGAERLLFGSGAPARPIQAALNAVLTATIADDAKRTILAGNAERLFGISAKPFALPQPTRVAGLIDVHGHYGGLPLPTPGVDAGELIAGSARLGIVSTIGSSIRAIMDDAATGNAEAFEMIQAHRGQLSAYVVVNPNDLEGSCRAMDRAYAAGTAVGAKIHCQHSGQPTASAATRALLIEVARRERPLKIHNDGPGWADALVEVARAHPRWKLIIAHGGPGTPTLEGAGAVERTENIYVEYATTFPDLPVIREVTRRVGPDRLLFGSDVPLIDPAYMLGVYADAGAPLDRLSSNAREVFAMR